jgi:class 3 adenylate cyclase/tetratricopeptide (TPR) repeat protein
MVKCPGCGEENPPKFRLCGYCGAALAPAAAALPVREMRKTVTFIFVDLKGSTALGERIDSEALHEVKERYFTSMAAQITRHGGKIEKYIGDAIMAVFGLPRAREDDALRAVRAALGMQQALEQLNVDLMQRYGVTLANRTGVNTGEVVASDDPTADQKLATGDAVNVTARLEQAAPENQIYLGETTYRLVRDAVEVEAVEPLELKGKVQRVPAWRLVAVPGVEGLVRRHDKPIVGRETEIAALEAVFREVCEQRVVRTVTLIGEAGFGKTRLVRELTGRVAAGARMLFGRCLPYGEGITFWPLTTMVRGAAQIADSDTPEAARAKLMAAVGDRDVAQRLASAAGLIKAAFPVSEINWAARKFFEGWAASGPLVVFVDDIHWAEPGLLDLLEHVQQSAADAPILILTTARHDLLDERPEWGTQPGSTRLELSPLSGDAAALMVANLAHPAALAPDVVKRIVAAAAGNALYAEQMLSMLIDNGSLHLEDGTWVRSEGEVEVAVPPTIHALLEARLDKLARAERASIEPASVIGLEFVQSALETLAPEAVRAALGSHLGALANKQFIHPKPAAGGDPQFRFHNHLVRETVYNGLLKRARANLHLEFVRWADRVNAESDRGMEYEEILGWHLEQAWRYLGELGPLGVAGVEIGVDAAKRLTSAGRRALARGDMHAAANLLGRAVTLLDKENPARWALLPELAEAQIGVGDFAGARVALDEAAAAASSAWDIRLEGAAQLLRMLLALHSGEQRQDWGETTLRDCHALIPQLEREGAHNELAMAWRLIVLVHGIAGRFSLASEAVVQSTAHARLAGNDRLVARNGLNLALNALIGPMPVPQAITECEELITAGIGHLQIECNVICSLAQLKAMNGELEAGRALYQRARAQLRDLGQGVYAAITAAELARVELSGGDLALAEQEVRADCDFLDAKGETYFLSALWALLALIVRGQGRDDEAMGLTQRAEAATAADDTWSQALWRMARAPIVARKGDHALALELARQAVELVQGTESPMLKGEAHAELAAVLSLAGQGDAAREAVAVAIAHFEAKQNRVATAYYTAWAASLPAG